MRTMTARFKCKGPWNGQTSHHRHVFCTTSIGYAAIYLHSDPQRTSHMRDVSTGKRRSVRNLEASLLTHENKYCTSLSISQANCALLVFMCAWTRKVSKLRTAVIFAVKRNMIYSTLYIYKTLHVSIHALHIHATTLRHHGVGISEGYSYVNS